MSDDYSVMDVSSSKLCVRSDVSFSLRRRNEQCFYLLEDPVTGRYFQIGIPEYVFLSQCNGKQTIVQAISRTAMILGHDAFSESEAIAISKWLVDFRLATTDRRVDRPAQVKPPSTEPASLLNRFNPVTLRVTFGSLDRFFEQANRIVGWLFHPAALAICFLAVILPAMIVLTNWDRLVRQTTSIAAVDNYLWLFVTWIAVKLMHETAHGVACKRLGGRVKQVGVLFILFVPLPFVDVTSSWKFDSRWQRAFTAAAGMYVELILASIATCVWHWSDSPLVEQRMFNVMLLCSVVTLAFNLNPLMRFDGYHILTDILALPNLATLAQARLRNVGRRVFFGLKSRPIPVAGWRNWVIAIYGPLAFLWRIVVACGLIWAAEQLFFGAGVILAVLAALAWFGSPLLRLLRFVCFGSPLEQPNRWQFAATILCVVGITWGVACLPNPRSFSAAAVVAFTSPDSLNANMAGTVVQVWVPDGVTPVKQGAPIVQLESTEVELRIQILKAELKVAEAKQRIAFREKSPVDLRIQRRIVSAYQRELQEAQRDRDELRIVAPADGNVFMSDANELEGLFATPARPLCGFGAQQSLRIHAYVTQDRRQEIQSGKVVTIRCHGQPTIVGKIENIVPTAVHSIPPSLSAINGGPIAVQVGSTDESGDATYQPIDKLFLVSIVPTSTTFDGWIPGRTGTVFLDATNTIGQTVWHTATQWVENRRGHAG